MNPQEEPLISKDRLREMAVELAQRVPPPGVGAPYNPAMLRHPSEERAASDMIERYSLEKHLTWELSSSSDHDLTLSRDQFLSRGRRVTPRFSPRVHEVACFVLERLGIEARCDIFVDPAAPEIYCTATLLAGTGGNELLLCLSSHALNLLEDAELEFVIGRAIGRSLFGHDALHRLCQLDAITPSIEMMPALAKSPYLRWTRSAEISADRAGLVGNLGDVEAAASAILKKQYNLQNANLPQEMIGFVQELVQLDGPALRNAAGPLQPMIPLRIKALHLFSRSQLARDAGLPAYRDEPISHSDLERQVDDLLALARRHPSDELEVAAMEFLAFAGAALLAVDEKLHDHEYKKLIQLLFDHYTDEPETVILTAISEALEKMEATISLLAQKAPEDLRFFLLSKLAEICAADREIAQEEMNLFQKIGSMLGLSIARVMPLLNRPLASTLFALRSPLSQPLHSIHSLTNNLNS